MSVENEGEAGKTAPDTRYEELVAKLNDPAYVEFLAKKHGMQVGEQKTEVKKSFAEELTPPDVAIDADTTAEEVNAKWQEYFKQLGPKVESFVKEQINSVRGEVQHVQRQSRQEEIAAKVKQFAKDHPDMKDYLGDMDKLFTAGYTIEESYDLAKMKAGKAGGKSIQKEEKPIRSSLKSGEAAGDDTNKKPGTVREAAKRNLTALLAQAESDPFDEKQEDEGA